jgi:glycosyltransferase involved in cell wall biosynthesis
LRIALNAIDWVPGTMGGIEVYFESLLDQLQQLDRDNDYIVLCNRRNHGRIVITNRKFSHRRYDLTRPSLGWLVHRGVRKATGFDVMRPVFDRLGSDVVHHPFTVLNPAGLKAPSVLTVHDIQHEYYPGFFPPKILRWRQAVYGKSVAEATVVIAISEHVKRTLVDRYAADPAKIEVVHFGVGPEFRPVEDPEVLRTASGRFRVERQFLYYPAATWPHKNHRRLLEALKLLVDQRQFDGDLLLTGIPMDAHEEILGVIHRLGLRDRVKSLGYVDRADLPALYSLARLMVFPSLFEGFGIPLVEAMACGCPVVCSNVTSIPEVAGDAAMMFPPESVEEIAETIRRAWNDEGVLATLRKKGFARARDFSWKDVAQKTLRLYGKAAGSRRSG